MDLRQLSKSSVAQIRQRQDPTIWRWFEFFPIADRSAVVSLGEGYTPLLEPRRLRDKLGMAGLYIKNDTLLPTGSLKDRSNTVGLSKAKELGFKTAAVASTGNAAASVAAYAAAGGLQSVVMVPAETSPLKIVQARACGATVVVIDADFGQVRRLYSEAVQEFGWYECLANPYRIEGAKSYAYELYDQLPEQVPDWIIHPTASGTSLYGTSKGYHELLQLGCVERVPRLVAAQSEAAAPIVAAFVEGRHKIEAVVPTATVAESIRVGGASSAGERALQAIRSSQGTAVALSDHEILEAQTLLGTLAGIYAEPAAASSVAAAWKLCRQGVIGKTDRVVCVVTGHGLKQPSAVAPTEIPLRAIPCDLGALRKRLEAESP